MAVVAEPVLLAGGYLSARLPAGERLAPDAPAPSADILGVVTHRVQRPAGTLRVESLDLGQRMTPAFAADVASLERRARCPEEGAELQPRPLAAPEGFAVISYFPDITCDGGSPPEARLFVGTPDGALIQVELVCETEGCLPDRAAVLDALVPSLRRAPPPASGGGPRLLGPSADFGLSLVVPEGFVVRHDTGEDAEAFLVTRPSHVDGPADALFVTFYFSASPNTVRQDYASAGERARMVRGRVAGRDVRFLELRGPTRRRSIARIELSGVMIDIIIQATSDEVRAQFERAIASATLRDPDAQEAEDGEDAQDAEDAANEERGDEPDAP